VVRIAAFVFWGCLDPHPPDAREAGGHVDATAASSGAVTPEGPRPEPALVDLSCAPTANELRWTCDVHVEPPQPVQVRFHRTDGLSVERVHTSGEVANDHVVPVYFLAGGTSYAVEALATSGASESANTSIVTDLPIPLVQSTLEISGTATTPWVGTNTPCSQRAIAVVYDTSTGDLVWYDELDPSGTFGDLNMVRFTPEHTVVGEAGDDVIEIDLMGNELAHLVDVNAMLGADATFWGLHHDVFARNGLYYVMFRVSYEPGDVLDAVAILDAQSTLLNTWYPSEHLPLPDAWSGDWLHTNTIWVDDAGDLLLSWTAQDTIGKVKGDPSADDFGTLEWTLAGTAGALGSDVTIDWSAIEEPHAFDYQHDLSLTDDAQVVLLDNGNGRGLVFELDEEALTATAVGVYPTGSAACGPQGTAALTSAGKVMVGCSEGTLLEYDAATAEPEWEAGFSCELPIVTGGAGVRWYPLDDW